MAEYDQKYENDKPPSKVNTKDSVSEFVGYKDMSEIHYGFGDGTVNVDTALTAGLKWAHDYEMHKRQKSSDSKEKKRKG